MAKTFATIIAAMTAAFIAGCKTEPHQSIACAAHGAPCLYRVEFPGICEGFGCVVPLS